MRGLAKALSAMSGDGERRKGVRFILACLLGLAASLAIGVASASALQTHLFQKSFAPDGGFQSGGSGVLAFGVAVDQNTEQVYLADLERGKVYLFEADGTQDAGTPELTAADGTTPFHFLNAAGVAVDNSGTATEGYVWVSDVGAALVRQFDASGAATALPPLTAASLPPDGTPQAGGLPNVVNGGGFGPGGVAVAPDGNLYLTDSANGAIDVFAPDGSFVRQLGAGLISGSNNWLALAPTGEIRVSTGTGVIKLSAEGECLNSCAALVPSAFSVAGDAAGNVYADEGSKITEFDPAENLVSVFGTPTPRPAFAGLSGISFHLAVNDTTGAVYVSDFGTGAYIFGPLVTVPTTAIEVPDNVTPTSATFKGAVDPDGVAVTECEFEYGATTTYGQSVPCAETPAEIGSGGSPVPVHADVSGLDVEAPHFVRLVASNANGPNTSSGKTFATLPSVGLTPQPPSGDSGRSVTLNALVKPWGQELSDCHFEYVTDAAFGSTGFDDLSSGGSAPCAPAATSIPADSVDHAVSADIAGLVGHSLYHFRIRATNANGLSTSGVAQFTTRETPPITITGKSSDRAKTSASLHGTVNPSGLQSTYHFEYGPTTAYGLRAPIAHAHEAPVGDGRLPRVVSQSLIGLEPGTTYHYRLVAENSTGSEAGEDKTFTTISGSAPVRAYELVSPAEKDETSVWRSEEIHAAPDGESLSFAGEAVLNNQGTEASPLYPRYVSYRTAEGWSTKAVDPPSGLRSNIGWGPWYLTIGMSSDNSKAVVISRAALAPGAVEGNANTYIRDIRTGAFTTVSTFPDPGGLDFFFRQTTFKNINPTQFFGGSTNFDRVFFQAIELPVTSEIPVFSLYEFHQGQLQLVSAAPDGSPLIAGGAGYEDHEVNRVSADGSHVFFVSDGIIYVRVGGTTKVLSESHRAADAGATPVSRFIGATRDGSTAFFFSKELTEDSEPDAWSLYRYKVDTGELKMLTPTGQSDLEVVAGSKPYLQAGSTGEAVYFTSGGSMTGDVRGTGPYIYAWYDGKLSFVAPLGSGDLAAWWASPNGRYLAFASSEKITDFDPRSSACYGGACLEIYHYDAQARSLTCASCRTDGERPKGSARIGFSKDELTTDQIPKVMTNDGRVFFDTPDQLVAQDTNSVSDVYEFDSAEVNLISAGDGLTSQLAAVGADGRDVFFTTRDRLVGIDGDSASDLYDARIGGGLSSQNPPPRRDECIRDDCKAAPTHGPELPFGGSEGLSGPENVNEASRKRCGKGRRARKVKGRQRCVKQSRPNRANNNRRQGR